MTYIPTNTERARDTSRNEYKQHFYYNLIIKLKYLTAYMWRSEDTLWDLVLVFHHAVLGNKLKLTGLELSTFTHWPKHIKPTHLGTYC